MSKLRSENVFKWQTRKSDIQCASNRRFIEIRTNAKLKCMSQGRPDRNDTCAKSISIFRAEVHNDVLRLAGEYFASYIFIPNVSLHSSILRAEFLLRLLCEWDPNRFRCSLIQ